MVFDHAICFILSSDFPTFVIAEEKAPDSVTVIITLELSLSVVLSVEDSSELSLSDDDSSELVSTTELSGSLELSSELEEVLSCDASLELDELELSGVLLQAKSPSTNTNIRIKAIAFFIC